MAIHRFICVACETFVEDTTTKGIHKCPQCGQDMYWDLNIAIHGNYKQPVHSDALAVLPNQRAEHEKLFPNVKLDAQCRPVFDNFTNHEAYLKKTGFVKHTQKLRRSSAKRIT